MARFLIAATSVPGHVFPLLAVSQHLVSRGHEVVVHTGSLFRERVRGDRRAIRRVPPGNRHRLSATRRALSRTPQDRTWPGPVLLRIEAPLCRCNTASERRDTRHPPRVPDGCDHCRYDVLRDLSAAARTTGRKSPDRRARDHGSRLVERGHRILRHSASAAANAGGARAQCCDEQSFAASDLRLRAAILQRHPREAGLAPSAGISFRRHDYAA